MGGSPAIADQTPRSPQTTGTVTPALKEWYAVCRSIFQGEQIITLRKGGLREEGRRFEVRHERFFLYPTFEHQAGQFLKPAYKLLSQQSAPPDGSVVVEGFCDVVARFEVTEEAALDRIDSMHIWLKSYALERLKWRPRQPLLVLALRAYLLPKPVRLPVLESYGGCKSWLELAEDIPFDGRPVLSDKAFHAKVASLESALS